MTALLVGLLTVRETSWQEAYQRELPAVLKQHGGRVLAAAPPEHFEGSEPPQRLVIFEFPDLASARSWYADPAHQPLIALRQSGAALDLFGLEVKQ